MAKKNQKPPIPAGLRTQADIEKNRKQHRPRTGKKVEYVSCPVEKSTWEAFKEIKKDTGVGFAGNILNAVLKKWLAGELVEKK